MVTARHHILTNEYRWNVSTNKTGDCLVRGYTMCGRSYTAQRVKWLLWDLSPMVFGRKNRLSILLVSLFSLARISPEHFWRCEVANRRTEEKKEKKEKENPKGMGTSRALKEWRFFVCPLPCQKMFVFCCFSFGRLLSPCALIKSRGQLKQQTVGGFVAACCSIRSLLIKGRAWILGTDDVEVSLLCMMHKKKKTRPLSARLWKVCTVDVTIVNKKRGFPVVKLVALMYPSAWRWKNRHTVPPRANKHIHTHQFIHPTHFSCAQHQRRSAVRMPHSWLLKLVPISVGSVQRSQCTHCI